MSETILDHGWVPEEHAPDPVIGHGDPTPPGKVAIWLFLASEVMFFIGLLATYVIFRSGSPAIFGEHAQALSKTMAGINTLVLIFSSLTMALAVDAAQKGNLNRLRLCLTLTILCAFGFMGIKYKEYSDKLTHHTIVTHEGGKIYIYDGHATAKTFNPTTKALEVKMSDKPKDLLRFDLDNENETIRNYRERVRQCEALGEYALAEQIRGILVNEQEHQIDLATALGKDVPDVTKPEERA